MVLESRYPRSLSACLLVVALAAASLHAQPPGAARASKAASGTTDSTEAPSGIVPWKANPFYWQYAGKPVLLVGGSDDDNLFQWPDERLREHLDLLASVGGNYIRNTMSDRPDKGFEVYPFYRQEDGRYDLDRWNDEYWRRFRRLLEWTAERGIFVQIEIWDRFDYTDQGGRNYWQRHPYHPKNNVNYTAEESGFADRYPQHPGANRQPFFFTTPDQRHNKIVLKYQQRFVEKLLSISLPFDHVLYCIDNETSGEEAWSRYWATFLREQAAKKGRRICVTEMWDDWNVTGGRHLRTYDHPELYDFVDISQNNHNKRDRHWQNCLAVRRHLQPRPRPINTVKTYGADGNKFRHTDNDGIERVWRHLLGGCASVRFHRPPSGLGLGSKAQAVIRSVRLVEKRVPFWNLEPALDRLLDRSPNEAYAASHPGKAHVVYFPARGSVRLKARPGRWDVIWIDVLQAAERKTASLRSSGTLELTTPADGHWVAVVTRAAESKTSTTGDQSTAEAPVHVLFIGKEPDHPWGSHMYLHVSKVLAHCVEQGSGAKTIVASRWPKETKDLDKVDTIVIYSNPAAELMLDGPHREAFQKMMDRGVGLVTIHWASTVRKENWERLGPAWMKILGGTWISNVGLSTDRSTLVQLQPQHPICRGWKNTPFRDEFYLNPRLGPDAVPLLQVTTKGQKVVVGWAYERPGGGRSFATTLGHFYDNFQREDFRRMLVNAILWTAKREVPPGGAVVEVDANLLALPPEPKPAKK